MVNDAIASIAPLKTSRVELAAAAQRPIALISLVLRGRKVSFVAVIGSVMAIFLLLNYSTFRTHPRPRREGQSESGRLLETSCVDSVSYLVTYWRACAAKFAVSRVVKHKGRIGYWRKVSSNRLVGTNLVRSLVEEASRIERG